MNYCFVFSFDCDLIIPLSITKSHIIVYVSISRKDYVYILFDSMATRCFEIFLIIFLFCG